MKNTGAPLRPSGSLEFLFKGSMLDKGTTVFGVEQRAIGEFEIELDPPDRHVESGRDFFFIVGQHSVSFRRRKANREDRPHVLRRDGAEGLGEIKPQEVCAQIAVTPHVVVFGKEYVAEILMVLMLERDSGDVVWGHAELVSVPLLDDENKIVGLRCCGTLSN